ncbi:glycosyltransferase family 2 protein [Paenibacillus sp. sgz500958]|uniref:glycosyltransferase family 2 protein n=1 Tax=Paenibacillus sp. sgz500958 TaxID=3242475 RepID=UPI0036D4129C
MYLSIVIPVYNIEHYVSRMLGSLLEQNNTRFEVIIVDDGSSDGTYNKVADIAENNPSLNCRIIRTDNRGVSAARNRGLSAASGRYVMFLDGDDYVASGLVHTVYTNTKDQEPDILCWGYNLVREDQSTIVSFTSLAGSGTGIEGLRRIFIDKSLRVWTGSIAYRRDFLVKNRLEYTERCVNGEDQEFIYKAFSRADRTITIPDVLSFYLQRSSSISNSYNVKKFDVVDAFKRVNEYFKALPESELKPISDLLLNREMTENYFFNLNTCLACTKGIRIHDLLRDIESAYPGLTGDMKALMKHYKGDDRRLAFQIKAYQISPVLYEWLVHWERNLNQWKRRIKAAH